MGKIMLEAAVRSKGLPRQYFQAVGSGTGGIAAWEASLRLIADGRFGSALPILNLSQNLPCAPIMNLLNGTEMWDGCPKGMHDDMLFNRSPALGMRGEIKDALDATRGWMWGIENDMAAEGKAIFEE